MVISCVRNLVLKLLNLPLKKVKKAYLMAILETNDTRLELQIPRLYPYVKQPDCHEFLRWFQEL